MIKGIKTKLFTKNIPFVVFIINTIVFKCFKSYKNSREYNKFKQKYQTESQSKQINATRIVFKS